VPVNCITHQEGTNEALYIGTDVGVFYTDGTLADWVPYQTGLPNVVVTELEISYNDNKLWAATFGRGLWNADLYSSGVGIEDQQLENEVTVYPNPNHGQFTIEVPDQTTYDLVVYNMLGENIYQKQNISSPRETIEMNTITPGIYVVHLLIDQKKVFRKIFVTAEEGR
jgi:hypothetical protein